MGHSSVAEVRKGLEPLLPRLWRYARILTRDGDRASDLVQSTCVRALENANQFRTRTHLDRWGFTIMSNNWKNLLRSNARERTANDERARQAPVSGVARTELSLFTRQVLDAVATLPDTQRSVVLLVCIEQYTYQETADILELPIGTVMSRLYHARRALARLEPTGAREEEGA